MRTYIGFFIASVFGTVTVLGGCSNASTSKAPEAPSPLSFPPYAGPATQLFDDRIDPMAVGLAGVTENPRLDQTLKARTQKAEVAGRMRVSTVTVDSVGGRPVYRLRFTLSEAPVVARGFNGNQIEVALTDDSPAFAIVKWLDTKLIGYSFVGFFHRFAGSYEPQIRFHLSPDDPQVLSAVRDASALSELTNPR
ncbi:MAG: hypothetical protein ABW133_13820 [Polyangiaceae bacterium]